MIDGNAGLFPDRLTHCLPEHLNDLKHEIHMQYGEVVSIEDAPPSWKLVRWREGQDPHQPRHGAALVAELQAFRQDDDE